MVFRCGDRRWSVDAMVVFVVIVVVDVDRFRLEDAPDGRRRMLFGFVLFNCFVVGFFLWGGFDQ